jgi:hypothetical protein
VTDKTISRFQWASRVLALLGLLGGIVTAADWLAPEVVRWSALATALMLAAARWCEQQIPARNPSTVPSVVTMLLVGLLATSCGGPYAAAYRTTLAVRGAGDTMDRAAALAVNIEGDKCRAAQAQDVKACVRATRAWAWQQSWRKAGVTSLNAAIIGTVAGIRIAEMTGSKTFDWMTGLRAGVCALAGMVAQYGDLMGSAKAVVMLAVQAVKGVSCE